MTKDLFYTVAVACWVKLPYLLLVCAITFTTLYWSRIIATLILWESYRLEFTKHLLLDFFFFFFSLAEASPFKEGDESSVDIYDGLDNGLTVPGRLIVSCCLSWSFIVSVLLRLVSSKLILHLASVAYASVSYLFKFKT